VSNPMNARCGLEDCDCGHTIEALRKALEHATLFIEGVFPKPSHLLKQDLAYYRGAIKEAKP